MLNIQWKIIEGQLTKSAPELKDNSNSLVSLRVSEYPELDTHITFPQYVHVKADAL